MCPLTYTYSFARDTGTMPAIFLPGIISLGYSIIGLDVLIVRDPVGEFLWCFIRNAVIEYSLEYNPNNMNALFN